MNGSTWLVERVNLREAIDSIYVYALKMGADAIIRFKIDRIPQTDGSLLFYYYEASGFAIKRNIKPTLQ